MGVLGGVRTGGDSAVKVSLTVGSVGQPGVNWVRCRVLGGFGAEMAPRWIGYVRRAVLRVSRVEPHAGVCEVMRRVGELLSASAASRIFF